MKFTIEHARKVAEELDEKPQARCVDHCKVCDAMAEDWELNVNRVLAALKVLEDEE